MSVGRVSISARVAVTIVLLWIPAAFSVVLKVLWRHTPTRIPTHWSGSGPADGFSDATATWVICLAVAIAAAIAGVAVIIMGQELVPARRSIAVGVCGVVAGVAATVWPAFTLSEVAAGGLHGDSMNTFVLFLGAVGWGAIVCFAAGPFTGRGTQLHAAQRSG